MKVLNIRNALAFEGESMFYLEDGEDNGGSQTGTVGQDEQNNGQQM